MKKEQVVQVVTNIQSRIFNSIENINCGGCGWFAYFMHQALSEYGIKCELAILDNEKIDERLDTINNFRNTRDINNSNNLYTSFNHCCVVLPMLYLDFDGEVFEAIEDYGRTLQGYYTIEEMKIALEIGLWTPDFDTDDLPELASIITQECEKVFGQYELILT